MLLAVHLCRILYDVMMYHNMCHNHVDYISVYYIPIELTPFIFEFDATNRSLLPVPLSSVTGGIWSNPRTSRIMTGTRDIIIALEILSIGSKRHFLTFTVQFNAAQFLD